MPPDDRPAALVEGRAVTWGELRDRLSELAGAAALEEIILERRLREDLAAAGLTVGPEALQRERMMLRETLDADRNVSARLLQSVRTRQGLGPVRFEALLFQNAALRALVAEGAALTPADVDAELMLTYGPRRQARLILVATAVEAVNIRDELVAGADFAGLAAERSSDISATRGGLLEPISVVDPTYPGALRETIAALELDEISGPVLLGSQFAVIKLVREIPAQAYDRETVLEDVRRRAGRRKQRVAMDALARSLLADVDVVVFDASLDDSWQRRRQAMP